MGTRIQTEPPQERQIIRIPPVRPARTDISHIPRGGRGNGVPGPHVRIRSPTTPTKAKIIMRTAAIRRLGVLASLPALVLLTACGPTVAKAAATPSASSPAPTATPPLDPALQNMALGDDTTVTGTDGAMDLTVGVHTHWSDHPCGPQDPPPAD